ncbi:MAG: ferredoxin, partial [Verrucomicrobiia bacterium]
MKTSTELEREAALQVAALMVAAARTAPKTRGIDNIHALAIDDQPTMESLVNAMRSIGQKENRPSMVR